MLLRARLVLFVALLSGSVLSQWDPYVTNGQVIVHLFEWRWSDIASECENFLGPKGYGGVQVSPPTECVVAFLDQKSRPWWERYQPVSYEIASRSGDEAAFKDMVHRCNAAGVRIYVDVVINHMTGWWPEGTGATGGTSFNAGSESYPGVPYSGFDFNDANCRTASGNIENYGDAEQVRNCKLVGLNDLNQGTEYVREMIRNYLNKLSGWGVAGFRVDAGKHMWPGDLKAIFDSLDNLSTEYFQDGSPPFILQEVIDYGGEAISSLEYVGNGRVTEFRYGRSLADSFRGRNPLKWFSTFGESWGMVDRASAVVFIDNHDNQRTGGDSVLTFRSSKWYKMANAFMLAWPYGFTRVMSSYYWDQRWENGQDENDWIGPPHDDQYNIVGPTFNEDDSCGNGWICEHRWRQLYSMVGFRNLTHGTDMNDWWDNDSNQISFCRGDKGFLAVNNDSWDLKQTLQTCMSPGVYCDVISGSKVDGSCTGKSVTVGSDGRGYVEINTSDEDGVLAIHQNSKL